MVGDNPGQPVEVVRPKIPAEAYDLCLAGDAGIDIEIKFNAASAAVPLDHHVLTETHDQNVNGAVVIGPQFPLHAPLQLIRRRISDTRSTDTRL